MISVVIGFAKCRPLSARFELVEAATDTGRQPKWPARVLKASMRQLSSTARPPCPETIVTTSAASPARPAP
jgi:hypothetical protein